MSRFLATMAITGVCYLCVSHLGGVETASEKMIFAFGFGASILSDLFTGMLLGPPKAD